MTGWSDVASRVTTTAKPAPLLQPIIDLHAKAMVRANSKGTTMKARKEDDNDPSASLFGQSWIKEE
jgi:hypothetical protein